MTHRKLHHSFLESTLSVIYWLPHERWLARVAGALSAFAPALVLANPTGGQVVAGSATIGTAGSNDVIINQSSQRASINWQQFSIGSNEYVQFNQPNSSSVVLNRVIGSNPSSIFGSIRANGQVFLINPNGILFAPGSSLDVSSLTASTLDISDASFMAGRYVFSKDRGALDASVINQGAITVTRGGYVVLSGDYVENDGVIQAQTGRVVLASGRRADLTLSNGGGLISYKIDAPTLARLAGVDNAGSIAANGGVVVMTADVANALTATAVNNSGLITARSVSQRGGVIELLSEGGGIENSGTLDVSATRAGVAGGTVILRGDHHTQLTATSKITAGGYGAEGGFIELSGHTLGVRGLVETGKGGNLLIDPSVINIVSGSNLGANTTGTNSVGTGFIKNQLNANANVAIVASTQIKHVSGTDITATGTGNLTIETGTITCPTGVCVSGTPTITPGKGSIDLTGLPINIKGNFTASAGHGHVTLSGVTAGAITITGNDIVTGALHATGPAASGNITVTGSGTNAAFGSGDVTINGTVTADHGGVSLHATGGGDSSGGNITVSGNITAAGAVSIHGDYIGTSRSDGGGLVKLASVTGKKVDIVVSSSVPRIKVGKVTANSSISITGSGTGNGVGSRAGLISAGAITAAHGIVNIGLHHAGAQASIDVGAVTAPKMTVTLNGNGKITTGALTANSASGEAMVEVSAKGNNDAITVNGNITATGTAPATATNGSRFSGPLGMPEAAHVGLQASTSCSCAASVKVVGSIKVTAHGHAFAANSSNEAAGVGQHTYTINGSGGVGDVSIVAQGKGTATVTGSIGVTGPDALVAVRAKTISVGNISVTAQGHNITRALDIRGGSLAGAYHSHNSAGDGVVFIGGVRVGAGGSASYGGPATSIHTGAITVTGKGVADVDMLASSVAAGNITAIATAAKGTVTTTGGLIDCRGACLTMESTEFFHGIGMSELGTGSLNGGRATIEIGAGSQGVFGSSAAKNVTLGNLSATGVGLADIRIDGTAVKVGGITVAATKGTEKGKGSSNSGANGSNHFAHSFAINGGEADIKIVSGGSGSNGGVLTQNGGTVTIAGAVTATGPEADVDVKAKSIKISGGLTVTGSGETFASDTVFTPATGTGYHVHVTGASEPTALFLQGATSGSVSVAGKTSLKGPGLVGAIVIGGSVKLHGLTASASASVNYSILDTRVSPTTQNFTAGSVTLLTADVGIAGGKPAFTSASDVGGLVLKAKGNVDMAAEITVSGGLNVQAGGNIFGSSDNVVTRFAALGNAHPHAGSHAGSNGGPSPGALPALTLKANAAFMQAGADIDLSASKLTIGTGVVLGSNGQPLQAGDATLLGGLGQAGLAPASAAPNGAFVAGGSVALGGLTLNGSYLYLQGADISVVGKVTMPKGTLVQFVPSAVTGSIDAEGTGAAGATLNLNDNGLFNAFPDGITLVLGGTGQSGAVALGNNGTFDIGSDNLIVDTTGTISGLGNVISTGQVVSLSSLLNGVPPVTAGEIDPTSDTTNPNDDKNKQGQGGLAGTDTGSQPSISQDTGNSSVCH